MTMLQKKVLQFSPFGFSVFCPFCVFILSAATIPKSTVLEQMEKEKTWRQTACCVSMSVVAAGI